MPEHHDIDPALDFTRDLSPLISSSTLYRMKQSGKYTVYKYMCMYVIYIYICRYLERPLPHATTVWKELHDLHV